MHPAGHARVPPDAATGDPDRHRGRRVALPKSIDRDASQLYVKEPTFAKGTVGRPASTKIPARQALAHRARILAEEGKNL
jgi:hypothetical protein